MSQERRLLAASIDSRIAWEAITKHTNKDHLSEAGNRIIKVVSEYYERDPKAKEVEHETIKELVLQSVSNPKHKDMFTTVMENVFSEDVSGINVAEEIIGARRDSVGGKLATALAAGRHDEAKDLLDDYAEASVIAEEEEESELLCAPNIAELFESQSANQLIKMYPRSLDQRLGGGLARGHAALVFARPEMGKTMFIVNLIRGFLIEGHRVLYLANEEPIKFTMARFVSRLAELNSEEIINDPTAAQQLAEEKGYTNLVAKQLAPGTLREIEELVAEVKPDVLVVDQIRNIKTKDDNLTRTLEIVARGIRTLGLRHNCATIMVSQAGDSAEGKAVLRMGDLADSNTGVQGAVDVMFGIGATYEDEQAGRRVISLCKNKRTGNHDFFPVRVDPVLNKVTSME